MTIQQKIQSMLEEAFGNKYWQQAFGKIHDDIPDVTYYDAVYKHTLADAQSLELTVQYNINDKGREHLEVILAKLGLVAPITETKFFTGKYAFKHSKEFIDKLD